MKSIVTSTRTHAGLKSQIAAGQGGPVILPGVLKKITSGIAVIAALRSFGRGHLAPARRADAAAAGEIAIGEVGATAVIAVPLDLSAAAGVRQDVGRP